jgi:hypothetical protein
MSAAAKSQAQAMYVVTRDDRLWLLNVQRKLHARSRQPDFASTSAESNRSRLVLKAWSGGATGLA